MTVKALWKINTGSQIYEPGELIAWLSAAEEDRLIGLGAAELVSDVPEASKLKQGVNQTAVNPEGLAALEAVLKTMTKRVLLAYAEEAGVPGINDRMRNEEIIRAIVEDAGENGIDLEAMTDEQLAEFALIGGVDIGAEMSRDEMLDVIEKHFGAVSNGQT